MVRRLLHPLNTLQRALPACIIQLLHTQQLSTHMLCTTPASMQCCKCTRMKLHAIHMLAGRSLCRAEAEALLQSFYPGKLGPKQLRSLVPPGGISCEWLAQLLVEMPLAQVH